MSQPRPHFISDVESGNSRTHQYASTLRVDHSLRRRISRAVWGVNLVTTSTDTPNEGAMPSG